MSRPAGRDIALAAALLVLGLVEASWAIGVERPFALALVLPLTVPLAWRRLHPSVVALVVTAALVAQVPWAMLRLFDQTFTGFVCVLLASYALGRHGREPWALLVLAGCTLALAIALGWYDHSIGSFVLGVVFVLSPSATGRAVAARSELSEVLDRQAEMLRDNAEVAARIQVAEVRGRIAGEVQDLVSHRVHEMVDRSHAASRLAHGDRAGATRLVATVEVDGRAALDAMRSMLSVLRSPDLIGTTLDPSGESTGEVGPGRRLSLRRVELLLAAAFGALVIGEALAAPDALPLVSLTLSGPLLTFVIGARTRGRTALLGLALVLAAVSVVSFQVGEGSWGDYLFPWVLVTLAWLAGRLVREQNDLVERATSRATSLERGAQVRAAAAATDERLRLARELHDVLAHTLMVMVVQAGAARRSLESGRVGAAAEALTVIEETGREATSELRRLLTLVNPDGGPLTSEPDGTPALSDLPSLVDRARAAGLAAELVVEGKPVPVPGGVALAVYRVAQEAVTNVIRHADAQHVHLRLRYAPGLIQLVVHDDGRAVPATHGGASGNGITGMRERTGIYGGELLAEPSPGNGFVVSATIPFAEMLQEQPA